MTLKVHNVPDNRVGEEQLCFLSDLIVKCPGPVRCSFRAIEIKLRVDVPRLFGKGKLVSILHPFLEERNARKVLTNGEPYCKREE
jgi:hypothetical protein